MIQRSQTEKPLQNQDQWIFHTFSHHTYTERNGWQWIAHGECSSSLWQLRRCRWHSPTEPRTWRGYRNHGITILWEHANMAAWDHHTVDGRNPAPISRFLHYLQGFQPSFWWCRIFSIRSRIVKAPTNRIGLENWLDPTSQRIYWVKFECGTQCNTWGKGPHRSETGKKTLLYGNILKHMELYGLLHH